MASEEHLSILRQGVEVWNQWKLNNPSVLVDLSEANLREENLIGVDFRNVNLSRASLMVANLWNACLNNVNLSEANLREADLLYADLSKANLIGADLEATSLENANLNHAVLSNANLIRANLSMAQLGQSEWGGAIVGSTFFVANDMSTVQGLEHVTHQAPSPLGIETIQYSKGSIPAIFLRGCGLSDWQIEAAKLYNPEISNEEINKILYDIYDLRGNQAIQLSPLFISYSHSDCEFVDTVGDRLTEKGIRYWRDTHKMTSGKLEKQIDQAIRQNPTVLLVLSKNSLSSDWVEHEVRSARRLEKELDREILCPIALDDSWKSSPWPARIMDQIREYNILDFSDWRDNRRLDIMFQKLIDGLSVFYKPKKSE